MTLREKIECMEAFERGEEIEIKHRDSALDWTLTKQPTWNWNSSIYRIKPKPKQVVVIEKWLCKSAWDNYFIIEGEVAFFKTGGYDKQQVKLLDTYEVEL